MDEAGGQGVSSELNLASDSRSVPPCGTGREARTGHHLSEGQRGARPSSGIGMHLTLSRPRREGPRRGSSSSSNMPISQARRLRHRESAWLQVPGLAGGGAGIWGLFPQHPGCAGGQGDNRLHSVALAGGGMWPLLSSPPGTSPERHFQHPNYNTSIAIDR